MPPISLGLGLGLSRGGRPFSPRDLSPALDLDASRDVYGTGATDVLFWLDQSGNGRDFSQASGATQPIYTPAGADSYVTLGAGRWLQGAGTAASWGWLHSAASYVVAVGYLPASATTQSSGLITTSPGAGSGMLTTAYCVGLAVTGGAEMYVIGAAGAYASVAPAGIALAAPTMIEYLWQPSASPYARVLSRGVELGTDTSLSGAVPDATPQYAARVGRYSASGTGDTYSYRLYRLLAWDRIPSVTERDQLRRYIAWRYPMPMTLGA